MIDRRDRDVVAHKRRVYGSALLPSLESLAKMKLQFAASQRALSTIMQWLIEPLQVHHALTRKHTIMQRRIEPFGYKVVSSCTPLDMVPSVYAVTT